MARSNSLIDSADGRSLVDPKPLAPKVDGTVYVMRHGRTSMDMGSNRSDGWLDFPLTDEGRVKLIPAQQMLKLEPLTAIYAADLLRTSETASLVKSGTLSNPPVIIEPKARTWNLGPLIAGTKKEDGRPKVKLLKQNPDTAAPGGESFNEFKGRFLPWFQKIAKQALKDGPCLVVLSGSALRILGTDFCLGGDESDVDLDEGGLAALHFMGGSWTPQTLLGHEDAAPFES